MNSYAYYQPYKNKNIRMKNVTKPHVKVGVVILHSSVSHVDLVLDIFLRNSLIVLIPLSLTFRYSKLVLMPTTQLTDSNTETKNMTKSPVH